MSDALDVLVLCGGPDRERAVSLRSGSAVAAALRLAGHRVVTSDVLPGEALGLFDFASACPGGVVFPALHGKWGEGGGVQGLLASCGLGYVGCEPAAAALCMDKAATKRVLRAGGVATPDSEVCGGRRPTLGCPLVLKPVDDGSSIDLVVCHDDASRDAAWSELSERNDVLLAERYVAGKELTVGWVSGLGLDGGVLPPIWIQPASAFYDYDAKYERDDTRYAFELDESPEVLSDLRSITLRCVALLGVRHLCRVDFMLDAAGTPWVLEVNTMPGFTDHSLLPKASAEMGTDLAALCDHLVRRAAAE